MIPTLSKKIRKSKFAGVGAIVQLVGVLFCLTIIGAIIGIPLFIIGSSMSRYFVCGNCLNTVTKETLMCPTCHAVFTIKQVPIQQPPRIVDPYETDSTHGKGVNE